MKGLEKFKTWLIKRGAIVLEPTNEWEVVRFKTDWGTSVVYKKATGQLTFTGESRKAYDAFTHNRNWKTVNRQRQNLRAKKARLATRDGKKCFFHGEYLPFDKLTIEHLVAVSHGGPDHDSNLCLACEPCNKAVANMSVVQKMAFRDRMLAEVRISVVNLKPALDLRNV